MCPRARSQPPRVLEGLNSGPAPETIRALARLRAASVLSFRGADGVLARDRRDLLDHVIVLNERHLHRLLAELVAYYHDDRTHLGLAKATPAMRTASAKQTGDSEVVAIPRIGGLHHRYEWRQAA